MRIVALALLLAIPFVAIEAYLRGLDTGEKRPAPLNVDGLHAALRHVTPGSYGTAHYEDERREVEAIAAAYNRGAFVGD